MIRIIAGFVLALFGSDLMHAQQLTHTCKFDNGPRAGLTLAYPTLQPIPVGSFCRDGVASTGVAVPDNPNPQLTHSCKFDQGPRTGQTQVMAQTMPVGASCWDGVSSGGVTIADNTSAPEPAKPPAQNSASVAPQEQKQPTQQPVKPQDTSQPGNTQPSQNGTSGDKKPAQDEPTHVAGTWAISRYGKAQGISESLTIQQDGGSIKGTLKGEGNGSEYEVPLEGTVRGNKIEITLKFSAVPSYSRQGIRDQILSGTLEGDYMRPEQSSPRSFWTAGRTLSAEGPAAQNLPPGSQQEQKQPPHQPTQQQGTSPQGNTQSGRNGTNGRSAAPVRNLTRRQIVSECAATTAITPQEFPQEFCERVSGALEGSCERR